MGWFKRCRHSKGFGIHSPFAFRFVTEVLEERLPYYDYSVVVDRRGRLLYRLACRFSPGSVCALGIDASPIMMACTKAVDGTPEDCDMLIAGAGVDPGAVERALRRPGVVTVLSGKGIKGMRRRAIDVMNEMGYGMTFDNERDLLIVVANPKLPRQDFAVKV